MSGPLEKNVTAPQLATRRHGAPANGHNGNGRMVSRAPLTQALRLLLEQSPIIPCVRSPEFLEQAARAHGKIVYFLCGDPEILPDMSSVVNSAGKVPIVNVDLVQGLSRDATAIGFLARNGVRGIISTHPEPLRAARALEMYTIERTFLLDSAALETALRSIDRVQQDAVEVLPAMVAPHLLRQLHNTRPDIPVIAGGLISTFREIEQLRAQGIISVSVSNTALWLR
ncbi:MAG: glycerol-3-phosphate responsive antiterminator [Acidobacteria bacterium]|nr:glycerol-3-phosphate responsive antiterminator [Acidobacteriota bacterium]